MDFNKELFRNELEAILNKHKTQEGITWTGIKNFTQEARHYANGLFGDRSIDILPMYHKSSNSYKMTIYVNPHPEKYGGMVDYYFNLPVQA